MGLTETCRALGAGRSAGFGFACNDHLPAPWAELEGGIQCFFEVLATAGCKLRQQLRIR